jgi:hypothetical protein
VALEDVVQGVQVSVKNDGVEDTKDKVGQLDKAIGDLAKTAESASGQGSGGGRGDGAGIGSLTKAFGDLNTVSAQAFAQIAKSAAGGDITGLATMMGGPVVGSFVQAAESIGEFVKTQDSAILKTAAMAREFGTTPAAMQGIQEGFEGAGVSATGFERLVNRMSRQVQNDYAEMTRNIRTDSDTQEGAVLRLQAAHEKLQISKGADPTQFQYQDKLREQKFAQIAVDQAEEAVRQQALKSIPHVTELLNDSARAGRQNADITEVSTKTLRESIESMARVGQGPASPIDVLKKEAELIKSGAIDIDTAIKLLKDQGGMSRAAGLGGMDAVHEAEYLKKYGAAGIEAKQAGQSEIAQAGLADTKEAAEKATQTISEWSKLTGLFNAMMKTTAAQMSGDDSWTNAILKFGEGAIKWSARLNQATNAAKAKEGEGTGLVAQADRFWKELLNPTPPKVEKIDPKTGKPVDSTQPTRTNIGTGPGQMIHIPEGWTGSPPVTKETRENVGSGPAQMIHIPEHYGEGESAKRDRLAAEKASRIPYDLNNPSFQHMSVTDDENAPWRTLRSKADAKAPAGAAAPAAPAAPPSDHPFSDFMHGILYNMSAGASGTYNPKTDFIGSGPSREAPAIQPSMGTAAPVTVPIPGAAPPALPPITVNPTSPTINVNVVAPIAVSVNGATATSTPGTGTASVAGHWQGGYISGFAGGGSVSDNFSSIPGFAEGGSPNLYGETEGEKYLWGKIKESPKAIVDTIKELGPERAKGWLLEKGIKYGVTGLLAAAGFTPQGRAIEIGAAAASEVLSPVTVGAADWNAGGRDVEARGRAMGAHNLKEMDELDRSGMWRGGIPGFAQGSIKGPGTGTSDSILARLSNGEFVMKDAAVRTYGTGFMHAINNMQIPPPKYAGGGMVPVSSLPRFAAEGGMERPGSTLNLHVGGEVFKGLKAPAAVADQLRKFAIDQQTSQTGKKPSWAGG